jgi:hypothetical protein
MVLVVAAPALAPVPAAGPAPAMGPLIRDLARALAACPQTRGGAIQIRVPFSRALAQAVDAIGEAFAWHGCQCRRICLIFTDCKRGSGSFLVIRWYTRDGAFSRTLEM